MESESPDLNTKELFSDRGFLVYVCRTYDVLTTYLKGFHLTMMVGVLIEMEKDGKTLSFISL